MKFAKPLSPSQKQELEQIYKHHSQHRVRQRAHAILLSDRGYPIKALAALYDVKRDTMSAWLDAWEADGVSGLAEDPRSGRPMLLTEDNREQFKALLDENPHQLKRTVACFEEDTGVSASLKTYKRTLKNF